MRYAIISDLHANWQAWCAVRDDILQQNIDAIVCLGDVVGYGPRPAEVLADLQAHCRHFILGNHDAAVVRRLDLRIFNEYARHVAQWTMTQLPGPAKQAMREWPTMLEDDRCTFVHAEVVAPESWGYVESEDDAKACLAATTKQLIFLGHTHRAGIYVFRPGQDIEVADMPFVQIEPDVRYLVNVGSVGDPRDGTALASYCICDLAANRVELRQVTFDCTEYSVDLTRCPILRQPRFLSLDGVVDTERAVNTPRVADTARRAPSSRSLITADGGETRVPTADTPSVKKGMWKGFVALLVVAVTALSAGGVYLLYRHLHPSPSASVDTGELELNATNAVLRGESIRLTTTPHLAPYIGSWLDPKSTATWTVTIPAAGRYEVELNYAVDPHYAGSTYTIRCGGATLTGRLEATGSWLSFGPTTVGQLSLPAGRTTVVVKARKIAGTSFMNLQSIVLRPVKGS